MSCKIMVGKTDQIDTNIDFSSRKYLINDEWIGEFDLPYDISIKLASKKLTTQPLLTNEERNIKNIIE